MARYFIIFCLFFVRLDAFQGADISFLVVDFKHSEEQGVKICEIQRARGSKFAGYQYTHPDNPTYIADQFDAWFSQYPLSKWVLSGGLADLHLYLLLRNKWQYFNSLDSLTKNHSFIQDSTLSIGDSDRIDSYGGVLYCRSLRLLSFDQFYSQYPSMLLMDAAFIPFDNNKNLVNQFFSMDEQLAQFNPRWGIYSKEYTTDLAATILQDLGCDQVVIKPSGSALGNGVIIVSERDLDETLKLILTNQKKCEKSKDRSYRYWAHDSNDTFLVEEFVASDPVSLPHSNGRLYDPTIRYVFILSYDGGIMRVKLLDGYCKLPSKALSEQGSLNDLHKSCGKEPYYYEVTDEMKIKIEPQLEEALLRFYEQMLLRNACEITSNSWL